MANRAEETDFSLHLMLSLQCRAPGLPAADSPFLPFFHSLPGTSWEGLLQKLFLRKLLLRVRVTVQCPTSDLTQEGEVEFLSGEPTLVSVMG